MRATWPQATVEGGPGFASRRQAHEFISGTLMLVKRYETSAGPAYA